MTKQKHLKRRVRQRMLKTGESYVSARRNVLRQASPSEPGPSRGPHFPGKIPAATALRALLAHRGMRDPHTGQPFSEAMVFGIAGGIGAGVFTFRYEKEDFSSFFVAGRHLWEDDLSYLLRGSSRFGVETQTQEATGAKKGLLQLQEMLQAAGPVIAWVDMANLPYRGMPEHWSGGGYHVVLVYELDLAQGRPAGLPQRADLHPRLHRALRHRGRAGASALQRLPTGGLPGAGAAGSGRAGRAVRRAGRGLERAGGGRAAS